MNLTQQQTDQIRRLLKLADISQEFEHVELKLSDQWCSLREEHGLAKLLLMIETYAATKSEPKTQTP